MKVPGLEAVVNAARSLGSNRRGKGGVRGYMVEMASQQPKRFARLLEKALQTRNSEWREGGAVLEKAEVRVEQAEARIRKMSVDEIVLNYVIHIVEPPLDDDPPSSATDILDAIIAAAARHGSNGHGKGGVAGYIRFLALIGCRPFDSWVIHAMDAQVKARSPQSIEEANTKLRERGMDVKSLRNLAHVLKFGRLPPEPPETKPSSLAKDLEEAVRYLNQHRNGESSEARPVGLECLEPGFERL
jgi:hypothetical protein